MNRKFALGLLLAVMAVGIAWYAIRNRGRSNLRRPASDLMEATTSASSSATMRGSDVVDDRITLPAAEWKQRLTQDQFRVLREKGTEPPFTGEYWNSKQSGGYRCAGCDLLLFHSRTKFNSGTGWPSYWKPEPNGVELEDDYSYFGIKRVEVHCRRCGGHLGHVFEDGPEPTGLRYCINSVSLKFAPSAGDSEPVDSEPAVTQDSAKPPEKPTTNETDGAKSS